MANFKHKVFLLIAKWIPKAYACEHVLHITSNKFDYLVRKGIIPHGRKRLGFNELSWVLKDLDEAKRYLANNKD